MEFKVNADVRPVKMERYVKPGCRVDSGVRVKNIELQPLRVSNLKLVMPTSSESRNCDLHDDCMGHLSFHTNETVLLPHWCMSISSIYKDRRGEAYSRVLKGLMDKSEYLQEVRSTLMRKSGFIRYDVSGCIPLGSMRGVATIVWGHDPRTVFIPKHWVKKIRYVSLKSKHHSVSRYFSSTEIEEGDRALLIRCPALTEKSCQPVKLRFWEKNSIGVHPAMCKPLHLDFDGDEVHIFLARSVVAEDELATLEEFMDLDFLGSNHIKQLSQSYPVERDANTSFMKISSTCLSEARLTIKPTKFQEVCGLKPKQFGSFSSRPDFLSKVRDFIPSAKSSMKGVISSHHTVSNKYCATRALKYQCNSIIMGRGGVIFNTLHYPLSGLKLRRVSLGAVSGMAASRLVSRILAVSTQKTLDSAKNSVGGGISPGLDLFTTFEHGKVYFSKYWREKVSKVIPTACTSIKSLVEYSKILSSEEFFLLCVRTIDLVCKTESVERSNVELITLAAYIFTVSKSGVTTSLSHPRGTKSLSSMNTSWISQLLGENLTSYEFSTSRGIGEITSEMDPYSSTLSGNWDWFRLNLRL